MDKRTVLSRHRRKHVGRSAVYLGTRRRLMQIVFALAVVNLWQYEFAKLNTHPFAMDTDPYNLNHVFDMVYVKNANGSLGKLLRIDKQLRTYCISYKVMRATTDSDAAVSNMYNEYRKRQLGQLQVFPEYADREVLLGHHFMESAATFGYIHTMLDVFADAIKNDHQKILILDDDIILCNNFSNEARGFFSKIRHDWKIVQLGASQYDWTSVNETLAITDGYYQPRLFHTYGSFALGLDSSILDEIIAIASSWESPFDMLPLGKMYELYTRQSFVAFPNMVIADVRESLIRGHRDQVSHSQLMRWRLEDFVFPSPRPEVALIVESSELLKISRDDLKKHSIESDGPFILKLFCSTENSVTPMHDPAKRCYGNLEASETMSVSSLTADLIALAPLGSLPVGIDDIIYYLLTQIEHTLPSSIMVQRLHPKA